MTKDEALRMAIETLEAFEITGYCDETIQACKEALEQPEPRMFLDLSNSNGNHPVEQPAQEPYRCHWVEKGKGHCERNKRMGFADDYGQPAPSWQGLNDCEINDFWDEYGGNWRAFAHAIEQALRNKNGY